MKAYTDIEQSKKLREILPLESADMCYGINDDTLTYNNLPWLLPYHRYTAKEFYIPCWSLSALLEILPRPSLHQDRDRKWYCDAEPNRLYFSLHYDNPVDACYEMILKLNEQNLL